MYEDDFESYWKDWDLLKERRNLLWKRQVSDLK